MVTCYKWISIFFQRNTQRYSSLALSSLLQSHLHSVVTQSHPASKCWSFAKAMNRKEKEASPPACPRISRSPHLNPGSSLSAPRPIIPPNQPHPNILTFHAHHTSFVPFIHRCFLALVWSIINVRIPNCPGSPELFFEGLSSLGEHKLSTTRHRRCFSHTGIHLSWGKKRKIRYLTWNRQTFFSQKWTEDPKEANKK